MNETYCYSAKYNCLIYDGVEGRPLLDSVPGLKWVNGRSMVVPFDLPAMQALASLGLPAESPIWRDYDWPIHPGMRPMAHQTQMAAFMTLHPRSFNLSDMRTGKTLAALWAYHWLKLQGIVDKCLVVAKLSTLERVWARELHSHFLGRLSWVVLQGTRAEREALLDTRDADVAIINYDGLAIGAQRGHHGVVLGSLARRLADDPRFTCVIIDESAALRNSGTRRWRVMRQVVAKKSYVWQMTGTPTPNAPTDAHAQKRLVYPGIEPWPAFRARTMVKLNPFRWVALKSAAADVAKFLQPAIRFERAEVMELPPMVYDTVEVPLTREQMKLLQEMKKNLEIQLDNGAEITAVNEAGLRIKLIQILTGAVYDAQHEAHRIDATPRLELLKEVVEEAGGKVIVFAPLTSVCNVLYRELTQAEIGTALITGATSGKERNDVFRRFADEADPRVLVADPGTVAHGVDLSAAATIVWYGPTDRVEDYTQANQRISGPRQRRGMLVLRFASTAIERTIFQRLDAKQNLQGVILDLVKEGRT